jgi:SecD/SecF fusion protein
MKLKGLVLFFAISLTLICTYQLSLTYFVYKHEKAIEKKAEDWALTQKQIAANKYPESKFPADFKEKQGSYIDSAKKAYKKQLLENSKDTKLFFGLTTYGVAKQGELKLGLDLQGGMSVTMEVNIDVLVKSLANYTNDVSFNNALNKAVKEKDSLNKDLITSFVDNYSNSNPSNKLATFFTNGSKVDGVVKVKPDASNDVVLSYLKEKSKEAFDGTVKKITQRIDKFGLASPSINPIESKGIINIELAGVTDKEKVRENLQTSASLQFFEVYTNADFDINTRINDLGNKVVATKLTSSANLKNNLSPVTSILALAAPTQYNIGTAFIKDTNTLNYYFSLPEFKALFPSNLVFMYGKESANEGMQKGMLPVFAIKTLPNGQAPLEGDIMESAKPEEDQMSAGIGVSMTMKNDEKSNATKKWADLTTKNVGKPIAVVLDNIVQTAPRVDNPITNGTSRITGNYTFESAQELADILKIGALPTTTRIVAEQIVGPTLGKSTIQGGLMAFGISFLVIFALMLLYFNSGGMVANIALILNLLFTVGILIKLGFTLTAPGIAGLVLTIGMAVDTNVIIFERIKEELIKGKSYQMAVADGYKRSMSPVLDAHVTTLLTAIILFSFGLGPVLGFATTQIIGILLSLFCGILVSRLITDIYTSKNRHFNYFTKVSKSIFKHATFKFIEFRKYAYVLSGIVLIMGIATFFNGFDQGVEFAGGRSYTITFNQPVNTEEVRNDLKPFFGGEAPVVKTVDTKNQVNITTSYLIKEHNKKTDKEVLNQLYEGIKKYLPAGTTFNEFSNTDNKKFIQSSQTVLPSISEDLKKGATNATVFALIAICLYIFIRFRDWRYSLGTIFSLLHDVLVTLIVFSFFRKIVPFPLEIDQHFIAAILTVIGFSMNDTVIVYDRIREDSKIMKGSDNSTIINRAINETLSRTVMTSLTVFLVILILFIFGGEVTRGFSFAMLIGIITGTYSSIFVAAPVLVDFAKSRPLGRAETKKK